MAATASCFWHAVLLASFACPPWSARLTQTPSPCLSVISASASTVLTGFPGSSSWARRQGCGAAVSCPQHPFNLSSSSAAGALPSSQTRLGGAGCTLHSLPRCLRLDHLITHSTWTSTLYTLFYTPHLRSQPRLTSEPDEV
jgi:hypothetical protein